ncbi:MAG: CDP-alcohol phosphatidyltransferase family protein [Alphaproteobacteria bacterium]|nr:CDP-alcohol phosphatidyltransferase family protein [Alphaproteobacteria bacterium]
MASMVNLPNIISLSRLLSVPVIVWLILSHQLMAAFGLFLLAALSDALDGFLARIFKLRTTFGAYLDPIADKILLVGVFMALGNIGLIELWVVILVVFRDVLIIGGILLLFVFKSTLKMDPLFISKMNTTVQLLYALCVISQLETFIGISHLNIYFGYLVGLTTILSGASYVRLGFMHLNKVGLMIP